MPARCVVNMLAWQKKAVPGGPGTRTAEFTALTFDVHAGGASALLYGETLVVPTEDTRRDPARFARWLDERAVEQIFVPNPMIRALAEEANAGRARLTSLRHISQAGEPLTPDGVLRGSAPPGPGCGCTTTTAPPRSRSSPPSPCPLTSPTGRRPRTSARRSTTPAPTSWTTGCGRSSSAWPASCASPALDSPAAYVRRPELTAQKFVPDPSARPRLPPLPHRRPRPLAARRQPGVPGPARPPGQDPRLPRGTREVEAVLPAPRGDPRRRRRPRGHPRRQTARRLRRPRPRHRRRLPARLRAHLADHVPDYMGRPRRSSRWTRSR